MNKSIILTELLFNIYNNFSSLLYWTGLGQRLTNCGPLTKFSLTPLSVNKILLKHSHLLCRYCVWLLSYYKGSASGMTETMWAMKTKNFSWSLQKKAFKSGVNYWFSKCGFQISSSSSIWEFVRNTNFKSCNLHLLNQNFCKSGPV